MWFIIWICIAKDSILDLYSKRCGTIAVLTLKLISLLDESSEWEKIRHVQQLKAYGKEDIEDSVDRYIFYTKESCSFEAVSGKEMTLGDGEGWGEVSTRGSCGTTTIGTSRGVLVVERDIFFGQSIVTSNLHQLICGNMKRHYRQYCAAENQKGAFRLLTNLLRNNPQQEDLPQRKFILCTM